MRVTLNQAAELLTKSQVVALPTETVYGLAASISHEKAIEQVFALKRRPLANPLIIHVSSHGQVHALADTLATGFDRLSEAFWPGSMTLVLPVAVDKIPYSIRAGLPTAAFRMPAHQLTLDVLSLTGPVVMPSANLSGKPSATTPTHVEMDFGLNFPVLDGGPCEKGVESTILIFRNQTWSIIRLGAIPVEDFADVLGYTPEVNIKPAGLNPICPGQLFRHYAPKAKLILTKEIPPEATGIVLGFADKSYPDKCDLWSMSHSSNPQAASASLYALLRKLDENNITEAWVDINFPEEGLWTTLAERLHKASH